MTKIKSKYYEITEEQLESKLFYLNNVTTKFNKPNETTQFVTLNILDTTKSVSLGGDVLRKNAQNIVTLRIKLTKDDGVTPRTYQEYDSETKTTTTLSAQQVCELLTQANIKESEPIKFSKFDRVKPL